MSQNKNTNEKNENANHESDREKNHPSCSGSGRISRNFSLRQLFGFSKEE